jgi:mRNA interferase RelE/StbE
MLHPSAVESLGKLDDTVRRLVKRLETLETRPKKGKRLRLSRFYNLRIGDFRAIYEVWEDQKIVVILLIDHRKNVYEELDRLY